MADHREQEQQDKVIMVPDLALLGIQAAVAEQARQPHKQAVRLPMAA
jgi:hypothetical protein